MSETFLCLAPTQRSDQSTVATRRGWKRTGLAARTRGDATRRNSNAARSVVLRCGCVESHWTPRRNGGEGTLLGLISLARTRTFLAMQRNARCPKINRHAAFPFALLGLGMHHEILSIQSPKLMTLIIWVHLLNIR